MTPEWQQVVDRIGGRAAGKKSPAELARDLDALIEDAGGGVLPDDYIEFVNETGGYCATTGNPMFVAGKHRSSIQTFYETGTDTDYDQREILREYKGRIPGGFVPVAEDPGQNILLLQVRGPGTGRVYYWDHENEGPDDAVWFDNMHLVAETFREFLNGLQPRQV